MIRVWGFGCKISLGFRVSGVGCTNVATTSRFACRSEAEPDASLPAPPHLRAGMFVVGDVG